jgi:hypothetical protein
MPFPDPSGILAPGTTYIAADLFSTAANWSSIAGLLVSLVSLSILVTIKTRVVRRMRIPELLDDLKRLANALDECRADFAGSQDAAERAVIRIDGKLNTIANMLGKGRQVKGIRQTQQAIVTFHSSRTSANLNVVCGLLQSTMDELDDGVITDQRKDLVQ